MKKRILGIALALATIVCMMPLCASAENIEPKVGSFTAAQSNKIYVGKNVVVDGNTDVAWTDIKEYGDGQYAYDAESKTLSLKNVHIEKGFYPMSGVQIGIVNMVDGLTIVLEGENSIDAVSLVVGIFSENDISIEGKSDASLKMVVGQSGINCEKGNLNIDGVGISCKGGWYSVVASKDIVINNATINLTDYDMYGVFSSSGNVSLLGATNLYVQSDRKDSVPMSGISAKNNLVIDLIEGGEVKVDELNGYPALSANGKLLINTEGGTKIAKPENAQIITVTPETNAPAYQTIAVGSDVASSVLISYVKPATVNTGDSNNLILFIVLAVLAVVGAVVLLIVRKNSKND